jgi:hypothetical protein
MESFDFKDNREVITNLIEKLVIPKFPKIISIEDIEHYSSGFRGDSYFVNMATSECLESEEQVEIDTLVKQLFKMASLDSANKSDFNLYSDKIMVFFDCGNGDGFVFSAPFGYKH